METRLPLMGTGQGQQLWVPAGTFFAGRSSSLDRLFGPRKLLFQPLLLSQGCWVVGAGGQNGGGAGPGLVGAEGVFGQSLGGEKRVEFGVGWWRAAGVSIGRLGGAGQAGSAASGLKSRQSREPGEAEDTAEGSPCALAARPRWLASRAPPLDAEPAPHCVWGPRTCGGLGPPLAPAPKGCHLERICRHMDCF